MTPKQSVTLAMLRLGSSSGRGPRRRGSWQHDYSIPLVEVLPYPDCHPCFGNERRTRHRPRVLRKSSYARTISTSRHRADCCVFVLPGYVLMLVSGLWMVNLSWPLTTKWIQAALGLWAIGVVMLL